jgi:hypothetical protein
MMAPDTWDSLSREGLPARVVASTPRYVVIARR